MFQRTLILLLVVCLAGCGACITDEKGRVNWEGCKDGQVVVYDNDPGCLKCVTPEPSHEAKPVQYMDYKPPEPYIGEYYECDKEYYTCALRVGGSCKGKCTWHKFRKSDVLDEHKGEIKVCPEGETCCVGSLCNAEYKEHGGRWQSRYFYYADVPDRFQKKREEIENER